MPRATAVPVTPLVVTWAVTDSGYPLDELAAVAGVSPEAITSWGAGESQPSLTQLRALANKIKRPLATFLLPEPPKLPAPMLEFRSPPGVERRQLNPSERRAVRDAARLQRVLSWIVSELRLGQDKVPRVSTRAAIENEAARARSTIGIGVREQEQWTSSSAAFQGWRAALEKSGIFVLVLPMGADSCRGFSLWDDFAPVIAVNTAGWNAEARIFSLFHEYAHLLTRTNSACIEAIDRRTSAPSDPVERWCEQFAAATILPVEQLRKLLEEHGWRRVTDVEVVRRIARHFKASVRATTLRLIDLGVAQRNLYASLPQSADRNPRGGGGAGRDRTRLRNDQYGARTMQLFRTALERDVVSSGDVLDYLDVPPAALRASIGEELPPGEIE